MKTANDVLSFEDINQNGAFLLGATLEDFKEETERFVHTFLEWDLYDNYIYNLGWRISYQTTHQAVNLVPVTFNSRVDTLQEAELIAAKKVSRYLGTTIQLEPLAELENYYGVIDNAGNYNGMVEIEQVG